MPNDQDKTVFGDQLFEMSRCGRFWEIISRRTRETSRTGRDFSQEITPVELGHFGRSIEAIILHQCGMKIHGDRGEHGVDPADAQIAIDAYSGVDEVLVRRVVFLDTGEENAVRRLLPPASRLQFMVDYRLARVFVDALGMAPGLDRPVTEDRTAQRAALMSILLAFYSDPKVFFFGGGVVRPAPLPLRSIRQSLMYTPLPP